MSWRRRAGSSGAGASRAVIGALVIGAAVIGAAVTACSQVVLLSPYDATIESRLLDYREELNILVKRAANGRGTQAGTFESSQDSYAALEARIEGLVDRASLQDQGIGCRLEDATWARIKTQLSKAAGLPPSNPTSGDGSGCVVLMLRNVQMNLADVQSIHADPEQCHSSVPEYPTCLRPAAVVDLLAISNQTIDAVLMVESRLNSERRGG